MSKELHDKFDALSGDISELIIRHRRARADRAKLLAACKEVSVRLSDTGTTAALNLAFILDDAVDEAEAE